MKTMPSATAIAVALTMSMCVPGAAHMGGMGAGASASASAHAGMHGHGFGFHHRFLPPQNLFRRPDFDFGAGFRSRRLVETTGGYGDYDDASEDDYGSYAEDDIDNLHFRVQEPFGPGDIGRRPPVRAEGDAPDLSDRMDPWHGYEPED